MSRNTDGVLINNDNIYGLVNPPPTPLDTDQPEDYQDPSSAAVSWGTYTRMLNTFTAKTIHPTFNFLSTNVAHQWASDFYYLYNDAQTTFNETKTFRKIRIYFLDANQPSTNNTLGTGKTTGCFPNPDSSGNWSGPFGFVKRKSSSWYNWCNRRF